MKNQKGSKSRKEKECEEGSSNPLAHNKHEKTMKPNR